MQTSRSLTLSAGGWSPWQLVRLKNVDVDRIDLYFFVVQTNPLDDATLVALMPVSEPPWACIAIAFSRDGVTFSKPRNVRDAPVVFRRHTSHAKKDSLAGGYSARGTDHPVANLVPEPGGDGSQLLYIHHDVKGTSYEAGSPRVAAYRFTAAQLRNWTRLGLEEVDGAAGAHGDALAA